MNKRVHSRKPLRAAALLLGLALSFFLLAGAVSAAQQEALAEKLIRLHVLANSDSREDQAMKLLVRDRVLARTAPLLRTAHDRQTAQARLLELLPELEQEAEQVLAEQGCAFPVEVRLEETAFPTRDYPGFSLPAGTYMALRVIIGDGAGQNWWCVVFPPLCTRAAEQVPAAAMQAGLSEEETERITGTGREYVLRFKTAELFQRWRQRLGK